MTTVTVDVDVDLDDFDDEDIREEYESRGLGDAFDEDNIETRAELQRAYLLHHNGRKDEAYEILWRHCLIKLNKVV